MLPFQCTLRSDSFSTTPRTAARGAAARRASDDGGKIPAGDAVTPSADSTSKAARPFPTPRPPPSGGGAKLTTPQSTTTKPPLPSVFKTPRQMPKLPLNLLIKAPSMEGSPDDSPRAQSVDFSLAEFGGEDSVQVFVRVRPCNLTELTEEAGGSAGQEPPCMRVVGESTIIANIPGKAAKRHTYDKVLLESSTQIEVFEAAGIPMVDNCVSGYNSSIFVYGQTGAGKTYTMMGELSAIADQRSDERGLAPRMIDFLFEKIGLAEDAAGRESLRYSCRCSCLEIYNETITDLLHPSATNLQMREDPVKGIYVDGLSEKEVLNAEDVMALMYKGNKNRHVGETHMNARSSRSHCVFTCVVERTIKNTENGVTSIVGSRLNLIDLAGSERVKGGALGGSQAQGEHFKEAVHINQSLTTLGRVIMELVEAQKDGRQGQGHHIPYRDSRLTFLLQDSLGGNAKTMIIANVSPSPLCAAETVSTLKFVSSAKRIRNKATINLNYRGDVAMLQKEIVRLNVELDNLRKGFTDPAIRENKELRERITLMEKQHVEDELRVSGVTIENARIRKERQRMEARMEDMQEGRLNVSGLLGELELRLEQAEEAEARSQGLQRLGLSAMSQDLVHWQQQAQLAAQQLQLANDSALEQAIAWQAERVALTAKAAKAAEGTQGLLEDLEAAKSQADEAEEANASLAVLYAEAREGLEAEQGRTSEALAQAAGLQQQLEALQQRCEGLRVQVQEELQARTRVEGEAAALRQQLEQGNAAAVVQAAGMAAAQVQLQAQAEELAALQASLAEERSTYTTLQSAATDRAAELERKLRGELEFSRGLVTSLTQQLTESQGAVAAEHGKVAEAKAAAEAEAAARLGAEGREEQLARRAAELEQLVADTQQQRTAAEKQAAALQLQLEALRQSHDAQQSEGQQELGRNQGTIAELQGLVAELREAKVAAEAQELRQQQELRLAATLAAEQQQELSLAAAAAAELQQQGRNLCTVVEELQQENSSLKAAVEAEQAEKAVQQAQHDATQKLLKQAQLQAQATVAELQQVRQQLSEALGQQQVAAGQASEQQDRIRGLQKEIIKNQELVVSREFELTSKTSHLNGELDKMRREQASTHSQLEARQTELAELRRALLQRDQELSELEQALQAANDGRTELEQQMKGHLVANTRQTRAFSEIMRLINWATTPPSSARSSMRAQCSTTPTGLHVEGDGDVPQSPGSGLPSPTSYSRRSDFAMSGAADDAAMPSPAGSATHEAVKDPMRGKAGSSARLSLQFDSMSVAWKDELESEADVVPPSATSPTAARVAGSGSRVGSLGLDSKRLMQMLSEGQGVHQDDDVSSPMAATCLRDQM